MSKKFHMSIDELGEGTQELDLLHSHDESCGTHFVNGAFVSPMGPGQMLSMTFYRDSVKAINSTITADGKKVSFDTIRGTQAISRDVIVNLLGQPDFFVRLYEALGTQLKRSGHLQSDD